MTPKMPSLGLAIGSQVADSEWPSNLSKLPHISEGDFNNVLPNTITSTLRTLGVDPLVGLIDQLLTCRTVMSSLGTSSLRRTVSRGTPQAVKPILCKMKEDGCRIVAYADAILFTRKYLQTLCGLMNTKLRTLAQLEKQ
ncbi:uncharacterized protein LOC116656358 [Drosophila ananassae]|uniref:uncharacterized protein LOC116656358 n=1 Tax=Drosophila ananassae TaxID=7217 RepID=UPI0013A5BE8C|nr:uncharacterized protein LOC116656358 [Drosophila ananassae]